MVFVVVSPVINKVIDAFEKTEGYEFIKRKGPRGFFYIDNEQSFRQIKGLIRNLIGPIYVFEVYGLYNGMIDLFAYLPEERKNTEKYYNGLHKDLSDDELNKFLANR